MERRNNSIDEKCRSICVLISLVGVLVLEVNWARLVWSCAT